MESTYNTVNNSDADTDFIIRTCQYLFDLNLESETESSCKIYCGRLIKGNNRYCNVCKPRHPRVQQIRAMHSSGFLA